ncbi:MAG: PEP-CTERM sorting domain-containing protein, partial [Phycisphaerae bacterium]|nr:PEP-CTERM sorting domain-containing protein [Phycisphaerae bacterium]
NAPADLVELDTWQHYALVKQPGEYSIYIDGDLQFNGSLPTGTDGPSVFYGTDETGSRAIGDGWRGYLDEFRISDEALTPDQFLNPVIPEPSTLALGVLAGVALLAFRSRRKLN